MLTLLFLIFLLTDISLRFWLAWRQTRYVHQHKDQVPQEFAHRISLSSHQRAARYTIARTRLGACERLAETILLLLLTLCGGLEALDWLIGLMVDNEMWRQLSLIGAVLAIMGLAGLPFSLYRKFVLEARFGFNRMTLKLYFTDLLKVIIISMLLGTPICAFILWAMGSLGTSWPIYAWLCWATFNLLMLWLFPSVIAPLFNKFAPLEDQELRQRINDLSERCGFHTSGLYVMDGSRRSAHGNAYFTGFGRTKRIVFFDTLLAKLRASEIEAVLAHELGHFKHKHILTRLVFSLLFSFVLFQVLGWAVTQVSFFTQLGVTPRIGSSNDALALILFFLVVPTFTFWTTPLNSYLLRRAEYQADSFAVQHSSGDELCSALVKLYNDNAATLTPDPIHSAYYDSHPSAIKRLQFIRAIA